MLPRLSYNEGMIPSFKAGEKTMKSEIHELTIDELELASGGRNMSPYEVTELGLMSGFIKAGGTVECTRTPSGAECVFKP